MADLSPLRRRMIEDMTVRNLSPATQRSYVSGFEVQPSFWQIAGSIGTGSSRLSGASGLDRHIMAGAEPDRLCAAVFYGVTLGEALIPERIPYAREPRKLPVVLSADEVVQFLEAVSSLKSRAALSTAYAAGLRASEVTGLRIEDIDSARGVIQVRHGKAAKDRNVMLSPQLLGILRTYWRFARPRLHLFPGRDEDHPIDQTVLHAACWSAVKAAGAGLTKRATLHTLRHSFATHLSRTEPTSGSSRFCSEGRHTAREQQAEARITYRFHPRFGETVGVRRRLERGGAAFLVVHQLDGTFACLPAWMTDEAASRFEISVEPHFPLNVLRSLRNEVDALLGFLASESKTERLENDAAIREFPAKPVRGRATVRRTACSSKERARDGHRGAAARDRGGAGKGGKRGERR